MDTCSIEKRESARVNGLLIGDFHGGRALLCQALVINPFYKKEPLRVQTQNLIVGGNRDAVARRQHAELKTDVKKIREKTGLSQEDFSRVFGIPLATLKNWEQGRRKPDSAVCLLLNLISNDPEGVAKEAKRVLEGAVT
ncbi:MAG: helix-turn-helix domain-containing protein [Betaproteobacteria bacterium]|nr:helix-turn-helix domain-containing protein [Betaproteobacteria bacterium]